MADIPQDPVAAPVPVQAGPIERAIYAFVAHRMSLWMWISIAIGVAIYFLAQHMIQVALFKLGLITIASYLGYWIARFLERGERPHEFFMQAEMLRVQARELAATTTNADERDRAKDDKVGGFLTDAYNLQRQGEAIMYRRTAIVCASLLASALGG